LFLHQYLCATKHGMWIYKTVDEWKRENPGVAENLVANDSIVHTNVEGSARGYMLNDRFSWEIKHREYPAPFLPVSTREEYIMDNESREIVGRYVRVSSGYGSPMVGGALNSWKTWLKMPSCNSDYKKFSAFNTEIKYIGGRGDE